MAQSTVLVSLIFISLVTPFYTRHPLLPRPKQLSFDRRLLVSLGAETSETALYDFYVTLDIVNTTNIPLRAFSLFLYNITLF